MLTDLRYGARMLLHAKGWTVVVVFSLALGIGANTAIFSALNGLLIRAVPVSDPDTLVRLRFAGRNQMATDTSEYGYTANDAAGQPVRTTFSYPMYQQFVKDNQTMSELAACAPAGRVNVVVNGEAEIATSLVSSGNYYRMLGITAPLGRVILPEDDRPEAPPVAVISDKYWRTRFGGDPAVIGKVVSANNVPVTIVGVLPAAFTGIQQPVSEAPEISFPISLDSQLTPGDPRLGRATAWWVQIMGRLKPGATPAQVEGNLAGVFQATAKAGLDSFLAGLSEEGRANSNNRNRTAIPRLLAQSGARGIYDVNDSDLRAMRILSGVVALVLLIVCANVANLLLSRATARQKEISVRLSMGATRRRLIGQLLVESLLLAAIGGSLGVAVGYWGRQLLPLPAAQTAPLDWNVLAFVAALTVVTGIIFGIAPAFRATTGDIGVVLKETSRSVVASRSLLGKSLLVVQVAISLVLLVGAGLFLRTLDNLRSVDVGFDPQNLVLFRINPQLNRYDDARVALLYQQIIERLSSIGGVRGVTLSNPGLLTGSVNQSSLFVQGRTYAPDQRDSVNRLVVAPNFFQLMGIPLLVGRPFAETENNLTAPKVAIVNEAAVRKYFGNQNPVGQRVGNSVETAGQIEIIGVLRDSKYNSVRDEAPPTLYVPYLQTRVFAPTFAVRTAGDPLAAVPAIREAMRTVDPNVPILDVFTQMEQVERRFLQEKTFAQAYTLFGVLSVLLAAVGLFGVMSYSVARRTSEIGIRMALGAQRAHVLGATMRESLSLVLFGLVIGAAIALGAGRFVASQLFGIASNDAVTIAAAIFLMSVVGAVAAYLPARRASHVDPMVALRYE